MANVYKRSELGTVLIAQDIHEDNRGNFRETFNEEWFKKNVANVDFVQDNMSISKYGVLRGMHYQSGDYAQAKLVSVVQGAAIDVAVDLREDSPFYGQYDWAFLSKENGYQFYIPRGFAHGFLSLEDNTVFTYKCDNLWNKQSEGGIRWSSFGFPWENFVRPEDIIISNKDLILPPFGVDEQ